MTEVFQECTKLAFNKSVVSLPQSSMPISLGVVTHGHNYIFILAQRKTMSLLLNFTLLDSKMVSQMISTAHTHNTLRPNMSKYTDLFTGKIVLVDVQQYSNDHKVEQSKDNRFPVESHLIWHCSWSGPTDLSGANYRTKLK